MNKTLDMIDSMSELPSQPEVLCRLQALIGKQEISSHQAAQIIETDQGFTARILRLVNSPFYGYSRQIVSVEGAITMLGFNAIHQLLMTTSLLSSMRVDDPSVDLHPFWAHSFGVGVLAKYLLRNIDSQHVDEVFISGIMHDIGRLVYLKSDMNKYNTFFKDNPRAFNMEEEREYFGRDHQELGEALAGKWNFPECVRVAIANHHTPLVPKSYQSFVAAVNLADISAHALNIGDSGNAYVNEFIPEVWSALKMTPELYERALRCALTEIAQTEELLKDMH